MYVCRYVYIERPSDDSADSNLEDVTPLSPTPGAGVPKTNHVINCAGTLCPDNWGARRVLGVSRVSLGCLQGRGGLWDPWGVPGGFKGGPGGVLGGAWGVSGGSLGRSIGGPG